MSSSIDALSQRDRTQHNTFVRWLNLHLSNARGGAVQIADLSKDLSDGVNLCKFAEVIIPTKLAYKESPKNELQCVNNVTVALTAFNRDGVELLNIHSTTIAKGDLKSILGMIWQLLQVYQIASVTGENEEDEELLAEIESLSPEERQARLKARRQAKSKNLKDLKSNLISFVNTTLSRLTDTHRESIATLCHHPATPAFHVTNLDSDWQDGTVLSGLVVALDENPEMTLTSLRADVDMRISQGHHTAPLSFATATEVSAEERYSCLVVSAAIDHADRALDIPALMDAEDMVLYPDSQAILAYVSFFKKAHVAQRASQRSTPLQTPRGLGAGQHTRNKSLMTVQEEHDSGDGFTVDDDSEAAPLTEVRLLARERRARSMSKGGGESLPLLESTLRATVSHLEQRGMDMQADQLQRFTEHVRRLEVSVDSVSARVMREEDAKMGDARIADDVRNITSAANEAAVEASKVAVEAIERATLANKAREEMKVQLDKALADLERLKRELARKEQEVEEKKKEQEEMENAKKKVEAEKAQLDQDKKKAEEEKKKVEEALQAKTKDAEDKEKALKEKEAELKKLEAEKEEKADELARVMAAKEEKEAELERVMADKDDKATEVEDKEEEIADLKAQLEELEQRIAQEREDFELELAEVRQEAEREREKREEAEKEKEQAEAALQQAEEEKEQEIAAAKSEHEKALQALRQEKDKEIASLRSDLGGDLASQREQMERERAGERQNYEDRVKALEKQVQEKDDCIVGLNTMVAEKEKAQEALSAENKRLDERVEQQKDTITDLGNTIADVEEELKRAKEARKRAEDERDTEKQQREEAEQARDLLAAEKQTLVVEHATLNSAHNVLMGDMEVLKASEEATRAENECLKVENDVARGERDSQQERADELQAQLDALTAEHATLKEEHETSVGEVAQLKAKNAALTDVKEDLEVQVADLKSTNGSLESQLAEMTAAHTVLGEELARVKSDKHALATESASLRRDNEELRAKLEKLTSEHAVACEQRDEAVGRACEAEAALEEEKARVAEEQHKVKEVEAQVQTERAIVEEERKKTEEVEDKLAALEELHAVCAHTIECNEAERKRVEAELASVAAQLESQRAQTEAGDATIEQLEKALEEARGAMESTVHDKDDRLKELQRECDEARAEAASERKEKEEKIDALAAEEQAHAQVQQEKEEVVAAKAALEAQLAAMSQEKDDVSATLAAVRKELESTSADRDAVRVTLRALEDALQEQQEAEAEREEKARVEREAREEEIKELKAEVERLQEALSTTTTTLDGKTDELKALQASFQALTADFTAYQAENPPTPPTASKFVQTDFSSSVSSMGAGTPTTGELAFEQSRVAALKREFAAYRADKERELAEMLQLTSQAQCENEELLARVAALEQLLKDKGLWDEHGDYLAQYRRLHGIDTRSSRSGLIDRALTLLDSLAPQVGITITKQPAPEGGVRLLKVLIGRAGYNAGLQPGEVIEQVNGVDTHTNAAFAIQFARVAQAGAVVSLQVVGRRGNQGEMYVRNVQVEIGSKRVSCAQIRELRRVASGVVKSGDAALLDEIELLQSTANDGSSSMADENEYIDEEDLAQLAALDSARGHAPALAQAAGPNPSPRVPPARQDRILSPVKASAAAPAASASASSNAGYLSPRTRPQARASAVATPLSPRTRPTHTAGMVPPSQGRLLRTPPSRSPASSMSASQSSSLGHSISFTEEDHQLAPPQPQARVRTPSPTTVSVPVAMPVAAVPVSAVRRPVRPTASVGTGPDAGGDSASPKRRLQPRDSATPMRSSAAGLREASTPVRESKTHTREGAETPQRVTRDPTWPPSSRLMVQRRSELGQLASEVGSQDGEKSSAASKPRSDKVAIRTNAAPKMNKV